MRALCSVRGPLAGAGAGDARALAAGARLLALRMPGQAQPIHFVVEAKARVKELKALASAHAQLQGMIDTDLFGLAIHQNGEYLFVDLESKLSKYAPKSWRSSHTHGLDANGRPLLELHLVVQFHVESPLLLHDEIGRHLYFLQLRDNVRSRDALPAEVVLLLAGLALQAEHGDADSYEDRDYFKAEDYAPSSLTGDWVAAAMRACHREHRGLSKPDAETRFIREVCLLPDTINSHRYRLKQSKSEPEPGTVWLLVTAKGIKILPDNGTLSNFIWSAIGKLSFDRKKFEIRTEEGKITLYSSSEEKCKYLFALCKETHQFSMKIAPKFNEVVRKEEEERKICFGYSKSFNLQYNQNKSEQRISVISSTSSNTTSGIVSDRVQSEDELEIMIDTPPAPSTESLAFAHLLDSSNSYFIRHIPQDNQPLTKSASMQIQKGKSRTKRNKEELENTISKEISPSDVQHSITQLEETNSLPDQNVTETLSDSPTSSKLKCTGSQCSSSCSTVIMARAGLSTLSRTSNASSLELGYSHTAQNSMLSDNSTVGIDVEYTQDTASALYDGLGQPVTVAASSETSGVYTMASSERTGRSGSKRDALSEDSRTEYDGSHYDSYKPSKENDLADFDSVSSILKNKSDRTNQAALRLQAPLPSSSDCVDGGPNFGCEQQIDKEIMFRDRTNSNASAASFHGDGSDPTDNKHNLLTASELSDLIVGRGVYPKTQSVSDTLDSVSDYVRLLPFSGDSYIQGHEDTAPSDDNYLNNAFFDRPPTPPTRTDSRKPLHLSLPNILDMEAEKSVFPPPPFPNKPPPPYEYNHRTVLSHVPAVTKEPPAYPGTSTTSLNKLNENEEVAARVVTSKPMITILKAEAGEVNASSERTFASPMVLEHRFQKSKRHQASSRRAERSKLAQGINHNLSPSREVPPHGVDANVLVAMMKLPPPPPPPRRTRLPPPPPVTRLPPPPPPHNQIFHQQLYSDVDYVYYPLQDPAISQQNYLDHKLTETRISNLHKSSLQYRSTPYLSTSLSASSMYGSIQNLSDSYIQLPGTRASWYSLTSRTSLSNHSINHERPPMPTRLPDMSYFSRTKSDENILNVKDPPPVKMRRMPPPPPPPYEHKKKLPTHLRAFKNPPSSSNIVSDVSASKTKDSNCDLDIKTLREKSKNLDLPLIAALCNDRSLLKQTKAFGAPKLNRQTGSDCESDQKSGKSVVNTTETVDVKNRQESNARKIITGSQKKILIRNPTDKLPALPVSEPHTPRAMSNTYVMHPSVIKTKKTQPNS